MSGKKPPLECVILTGYRWFRILCEESRFGHFLGFLSEILERIFLTKISLQKPQKFPNFGAKPKCFDRTVENRQFRTDVRINFRSDRTFGFPGFYIQYSVDKSCPGGKKWTECTSFCEETCEKSNSSKYCNDKDCISRCACPRENPVFNDQLQICMTSRDCVNPEMNQLIPPEKENVNITTGRNEITIEFQKITKFDEKYLLRLLSMDNVLVYAVEKDIEDDSVYYEENNNEGGSMGGLFGSEDVSERSKGVQGVVQHTFSNLMVATGYKLEIYAVRGMSVSEPTEFDVFTDGERK